MADQVPIELEDVRTKLGGLMLQIMGYEKQVALLERENAELRARDSEKGPAPVAEFPKAPSRAELLGSA